MKEILSKRERQAMDVVYRRGKATAADVFEELPDATSYNAVRSTLRLLEEKGHLRHRREERRYIYSPTMPPEVAGRSALRHLVRTFFGGSAERVVSTLFEDRDPTPGELERLEHMIEEARAERSSSERE